jgi:ribose transport system permease protein
MAAAADTDRASVLTGPFGAVAHGVTTMLRKLGSATAPLAMLSGVLVVTAVLSPTFFQVENMINVTRQASIVGVVAVGMTFVILTAGIDLSVGSVLALVAVSTAMLLDSGLSAPVVILLAMLLGVGVGLVNGIGVTLLKIQPFVMTLAMLGIARGATFQLSGGSPKNFTIDSKLLDFFGSGEVWGIPGPLVIFLAAAVVGLLVLRYLPFGRYVYAIGGSPEAARLSGVRVNVVTLAVYAISGLCAAIGGIMTASRLSVGDPIAGNLVELDAIAAVVIGGTSLAGGLGGMVGTVAGALLLAMLANVLNLIGVSPFYQLIVKGVAIIGAVVLTSLANRARTQRSLSSTTQGTAVDTSQRS